MITTNTQKQKRQRNLTELAEIDAANRKAEHARTLMPTEDIKSAFAKKLAVETSETVNELDMRNLVWLPRHTNMFADVRSWEIRRAYSNESLVKPGYRLIVEVKENTSNWSELADVREKRPVDFLITDVYFDVEIKVVASRWRKLTGKKGTKVYLSAAELSEYLA